MVTIFLVILIFCAAVLLLHYSSDFAVTHSVKLAAALGVSNLVIGVTVVSIGTDISEIINSIISCAMGHGDIDVGDSVGSDLAQLTLVFGLLPLICGTFCITKKEFTIVGACEILSLILIFTVVEKGYFTRLDAIVMIGCFFLYSILIYNLTKGTVLESVELMEITNEFKSKRYHFTIAALGFIGITLSAFIIINCVIYFSDFFEIHEYIISFFVLSIATSLPELSVAVKALQKKKYNLAIGNVLGSCIVDSTISIAIGQLFFPQEVSAAIAVPMILYTLVVSIIVIGTVSYRGKIDKKAGIFFISLYIGSYFFYSFFIYS